MEQFQMDLAGRTLTIETGELAKQAGGARNGWLWRYTRTRYRYRF